MCAKCGKPLGTSAIVWVSDTELYHYNCCEIEGWVWTRNLMGREMMLKKDPRTGLVQKIHMSEAKVCCVCSTRRRWNKGNSDNRRDSLQRQERLFIDYNVNPSKHSPLPFSLFFSLSTLSLASFSFCTFWNRGDCFRISGRTT